MTLTPYLLFDGDCEVALAHYARALGATSKVMMRHGDAPGETASNPEFARRVMHAVLEGANGSILMASDVIERDATPTAAVTLAIGEREVERAKATFAALAEGGTITMPMQPVFWGGEYGTLTDRYGMNWSVSAGEGS